MNGPKTVGLTVDGREARVPEGTNVLKAASGIGIEIPHFCYHPAFAPEGNCRMCLVEIEGLPKLELACSTAVREGMVVRTSSPNVLKARRDVLAFLLAEHPLDCPICDKAGECSLQDYYDLYGGAPSRFLEAKEKRLKKIPIGKSLLLDRERCVLCTRCVRFLRRVTGTSELGVFQRGARTEIGLGSGPAIDNNYSGNLVDICPVGAITDRDFRFKTRAWFLQEGRTVCPRCGRGCAVTVQFVAGYPLSDGRRKIYRIQAAENPDVNGFWICDRGRYGYADLEESRQTSFWLRETGASDLEPALDAAASRLRAALGSGGPSGIALILNGGMTNEELSLCRKVFLEGLGVRRVYFADPEGGQADEFLLTQERVANARGATDLGFSPLFPDLDELAEGTDVLFIFGPYLEARFPWQDLTAALKTVGSTVLLSGRAGRLTGLADVVLPTLLPAEKSGSFTNIDGVVQTFGSVLPPIGEGLAESELIRRLAEKLGLDLGGRLD
jgi:NADH-quinone oxidoreductase subunit G